METSKPTEVTIGRLNRFALYYLGGELAYLALLILIGLCSLSVMLISSSGTGLFYNSDAQGVVAVAILLPYGLAYVGNLAVGLWSLYIYVREQSEGLPGAGILLNWIFLVSTFWIFLFILIVFFLGGSF